MVMVARPRVFWKTAGGPPALEVAANPDTVRSAMGNTRNQQSAGRAAPAEGIDWEDAFQNTSYIPDGEGYPKAWTRRAASYRDTVAGEIDIAYGEGPRERLDLFRPAGGAKGLAVFIHGGFWLKLDKSFWSDLAAGPMAHGWAVALPSYPLAPKAGIPDITRSIGRAIEAAAGMVEGPVRLAGHSAGGHLASRMVSGTSPLGAATAGRVERLVSISGVHDLRPLLLHSMNGELGLTPETAEAESPALLAPRPGVAATAWVGARERPEFVRQSALLAEAWSRRGSEARLVAEPGRHHFDVIDGLRDPGHPLTEAFAGA